MNLIDNEGNVLLEPLVKYVKCHENASISQARYSDAGFDLYAVDIKKSVGDVVFFGTGIKVQPPKGYYFELVPRSSLSKTNWMLANSVGIIDNEYTGEILVPLRKMHPDAKIPSLPWKCVQLILMKQHFPSFVEVDKLNETSREDKGFGSTGN